jgi:hypothetical protein
MKRAWAFRKDWGGDEGGIGQVSRGACRIFLTNRAFREQYGNTGPVLVWLNLGSRREVDELYEAWSRRRRARPFQTRVEALESARIHGDGSRCNLFRAFYDFAWESSARGRESRRRCRRSKLT